MKVAVGYCQHDKVVAAMVVAHATDDSRTEFAATHQRVEMADSALLGGGCTICRQNYLANCKTMGIPA